MPYSGVCSLGRGHEVGVGGGKGVAVGDGARVQATVTLMDNSKPAQSQIPAPALGGSNPIRQRRSIKVSPSGRGRHRLGAVRR